MLGCLESVPRIYCQNRLILSQRWDAILRFQQVSTCIYYASVNHYWSKIQVSIVRSKFIKKEHNKFKTTQMFRSPYTWTFKFVLCLTKLNIYHREVWLSLLTSSPNISGGTSISIKRTIFFFFSVLFFGSPISNQKKKVNCFLKGSWL